MHTSPRSYKQLQPEDRMTIASLKQQNYSIRQITSMLQRSASTVNREAKHTPQVDALQPGGRNLPDQFRWNDLAAVRPAILVNMGYLLAVFMAPTAHHLRPPAEILVI